MVDPAGCDAADVPSASVSAGSRTCVGTAGACAGTGSTRSGDANRTCRRRDYRGLAFSTGADASLAGRERGIINARRQRCARADRDTDFETAGDRWLRNRGRRIPNATARAGSGERPCGIRTAGLDAHRLHGKMVPGHRRPVRDPA